MCTLKEKFMKRLKLMGANIMRTVTILANMKFHHNKHDVEQLTYLFPFDTRYGSKCVTTVWQQFIGSVLKLPKY